MNYRKSKRIAFIPNQIVLLMFPIHFDPIENRLSILVVISSILLDFFVFRVAFLPRFFPPLRARFKFNVCQHHSVTHWNATFFNFVATKIFFSISFRNATLMTDDAFASRLRFIWQLKIRQRAFYYSIHHFIVFFSECLRFSGLFSSRFTHPCECVERTLFWIFFIEIQYLHRKKMVERVKKTPIQT